jgi:cell wall-associated NlpC family hydrolase
MVRVIALHSIIPLRAEPSEASEMLTQMLFGETADVLEDARRWTRISLHQDGQEGWADTKMLTPLSDSEWTEHQRNEMVALAAHNNFIPRVALPMTYAVSENNGQTLPLTAGTRLPSYANGVFSLLGVRFRIDPQAVLVAPMPFSFDSLMKTTRFFLNVPYLWGGKNAMGMDCSGFTQTVCSLFGVSLPRNASEQYSLSQRIRKRDPRFSSMDPVYSLEHAMPGDLVFFDHPATLDSLTPQSSTEIERVPLPTTTIEQPHISHVGILLEKKRVLHCSGRVKVEHIDNHGILSMESADAAHPDGRYTHHLVAISRAV